MRRLALAIAIACVLSGVARAGEIHTTGGIAAPTPSPVTAPGEIPTTGATAPGEIHSSDATAPQESSTLATIILTLTNIVF